MVNMAGLVLQQRAVRSGAEGEDGRSDSVAQQSAQKAWAVVCAASVNCNVVVSAVDGPNCVLGD